MEPTSFMKLYCSQARDGVSLNGSLPRTSKQKQSVSYAIPAYFAQPKGNKRPPISIHIPLPFRQGVSKEYTMRNEIIKWVTKAGRNEALSFSSGFSVHMLQELNKIIESKPTMRSFSTVVPAGEGHSRKARGHMDTRAASCG